MCNFFSNKRQCPFYEIGCKFIHGDETEDYIDNIETVEEEIPFNENECHLCALELASRDEMMDHVENSHEQ